MDVDGTVTAVTGECAAYADLAPGAVILHTTASPDPDYLGAWVRQDGANRLVHLYLGVAGPEFGTEPPPSDCPPRFAAFYGDGKRWPRARAATAPFAQRSRDVAISGLSDYYHAEAVSEDVDRQHRAAWAEVRRLHRAAIRAHPDNGGSSAAFHKAWPIYEVAMRDFLACWRRKPAA
jgi:hypothetical protein